MFICFLCLQGVPNLHSWPYEVTSWGLAATMPRQTSNNPRHSPAGWRSADFPWSSGANDEGGAQAHPKQPIAEPRQSKPHATRRKGANRLPSFSVRLAGFLSLAPPQINMAPKTGVPKTGVPQKRFLELHVSLKKTDFDLHQERTLLCIQRVGST